MTPVRAQLFAALETAFDADVIEDRRRIYDQALGDLSDAQLQYAVERAIQECRFFPRVAELRAFVPGRDALPGYEPGAGLLPPPPPEPPNPALRALPGPPPREPGPSRSEALAEVLDRVMPGLRAEARRVQAERARPMTPEEIAARKAELRDQAKLVTGRG